ncbi:Holliday junction resolvase [Bacillus phage BCD7]|uniref:Uncharacterized protein n=1 Tax=Bacillus phage BCD7 TaxID=1136534 RepID=J9PV68_9CAUD|nr:Holliday junction resolvase [Bacillus phage BCD7]AEZ50489.1 hypothetical protein BCD7_0042 [Bacillus phage BCD7]
MSYIKRKSQKQEQRVAEQLGGKVQLASGAIWFAKADGRTGTLEAGQFNSGDFLIENKFTDAGKYSLKLTIWDKIAKEALRDNLRMPLLQIDIANYVQLAVLDKNDYIGLGLNEHFRMVGGIINAKSKSCMLHGDQMSGIFREPNRAYGVEFSATNQHLVILDMNELANYID